VKLPPLSEFEGTAKASLSDRVAEALRQAIFEGSIGSGFQLKQNDVAAALCVSPVPVREALQRMITEGLLVNERHKGVVVAPLSLEDFLEVTDLRLMLEPYLLRCSAPRLNEADMLAAEAFVTQGSHHGLAAHARAHWDFHRQLYSKANRPRSQAQLDVLYISISRYMLPVWASIGLSAGWDASHLGITAALRRNEIDDASKMLVDQIREAADRVRTHLERTSGRHIH
jgi:DNA-binding GntR family transcriptional regulator